MIVDDNRAVIDLITRALKKLKKKCEVDSAFDGFEAGRKLVTFEPDLVILDLMLPGIDGFKVCKNIRMDKKTRHIKVLAILALIVRRTERRFSLQEQTIT